MCLKSAGCVANSVDPGHTQRSVASDLGRPCLIRTAARITRILVNNVVCISVGLRKEETAS